MAIDVLAARAAGITLSATHTDGVPTWSTAELPWALILAVARGIPQEDASNRAGKWQHGLGTGLYGLTLGIMGAGRLGTKVAEFGRVFGMRVIAWSPNLNDGRASGSSR